MSIVEWVAAAQTGAPGSQTSNSPASGYFVIALLAVVLGLVVWIYIRVNATRSSKR
jgi:cation transport ATPase